LKFYFKFRPRPYPRNRQVILDQPVPNFIQVGPSAVE